MSLTEKQRKEFAALAEPMIEWLNENCHPHHVVRITPDSAAVMEEIAGIVCDKFIKD